MTQNDQQNSNTTEIEKKDYESVVRRVSERVWELWREDLRRSRERRADPPRK